MFGELCFSDGLEDSREAEKGVSYSRFPSTIRLEDGLVNVPVIIERCNPDVSTLALQSSELCYTLKAREGRSSSNYPCSVLLD